MTVLLYWLRVLFISLEFLLVVLGGLIFVLFQDVLSQWYLSIELVKEAKDWIIALPIALAGWILKQGSTIFFPTEKMESLLSGWPDIWKLKVHFYVGVFYACIALIVCIVVWALNGFSNFSMFWLFICALGVLCADAVSFYFGLINIRGILSRDRS